MHVAIRKIDARRLSSAQRAALGSIHQSVEAERFFDDPKDLRPAALIAERWCGLPPYVSSWDWVATATNDPVRWVAHANALYVGAATFPRNLWFEIAVLPEFRRGGIAAALYSQILNIARHEHCDLVSAQTHDANPEGASFMKSIGATQAQVSEVHRLDLSELDAALLRDWQNTAKSANPGLQFGLWIGAYPASEVYAMPNLLAAIADAPHDGLVQAAAPPKVEEIRQREASLEASGIQRWTGYLRDATSGAPVGYTELYVNSAVPTAADQGDTAVLRSYRNRGLGKWIKAALLEAFVDARPQIRVVRTTNAASNAPMRSINARLGFRLESRLTTWQLDIRTPQHQASQ